MLKNVLSHVLVIPDGNRRWAKDNKKTLEKAYRYALAIVTTNLIDTILIKNKVKFLSIYIISRNNVLKRTAEEVNPILDNEIQVFNEWGTNKKFRQAGIKFRFVGDLSILPKHYVEAAHHLEKVTKKNLGPICNLLAAYDAEYELKKAIPKINRDPTKSILPHLQISEPIDIIIRTGKEKRLSGAPLLQSAYAELFLLDFHYPDLTKSKINKIFTNFKKRNRRFGV